jgi:CRP/FNR family transcriptional regulator, cyclic AMP receptor protein
MAMPLLSRDTTSPTWLTFEKRRTRKASRATIVSATDCTNVKYQAQQAISRGTASYGGPTSSDVHKALIASGIFSKIDPDMVSAVSRQLEPLQFSRGDILDAQRNRGGRVYIILCGKVKVSYRHSTGSEMVLTILGPREIFGAITLFDAESREFKATALTEVVAVPIERDQFLLWVTECPEFGDQVLRLFARWLKSATNSLVDFAFADAQRRVANQLLFLRKRFGRREGEVVRVVHDLTLKDFAHLVGVAPKTILAALGDFEDRGWIRLEDNSVVIVDGQALASLNPVSNAEVYCA